MASFPPKTVSEVLSGFQAMVKDLDRIQDEQDAKFSDIGEEIATLEKSREAASQESARAFSVANKLRDLLGETP